MTTTERARKFSGLAGAAREGAVIALLALSISAAWATTTVSTPAGSGIAGCQNGVGSAASFNTPTGVATDSQGNVYIADYGNHFIRKMTPAGAVTTYAGTCQTPGHVDGPAASAKFFFPGSLTVDGAGNVYVWDYANQLIRKITPGGIVSTLAGSGAQGFVNGTGTAASFFNAEQIAADAAGNVYVADNGNDAIRKVTPAGVVSTFAGGVAAGHADGPALTATFTNPQGIAVDGNGVVYVSDTGINCIRKIEAGIVTTFAGSTAGLPGYVDATGAQARFNAPFGLAVDSAGTTLFVVDTNNLMIRKVTAAGVVTTLAGAPPPPGHVDGVVPAARFTWPQGVAVDSSGVVYVAEPSNYIRKIVDSTSPPPCAAPPNTTMVAWYPFDEGLGALTTTNLATQNTGTLGTGSNKPTQVPGKVAFALRFDGNDFVLSPSSLVTNFGPAGPACPNLAGSGAYSSCLGDFSIDAWIRLTAAASSAVTIVDKRSASPPLRGYNFFIYQQKLGLQIADGVGPGYTNYLSPNINGLVNNWHHVAVTVKRNSPTGITWYDNGAPLGGPGNPTGRSGTLVNTGPLIVGANDSQGNHGFTGDIDELEIFNRELTPAEVASMASADAAGKCK